MKPRVLPNNPAKHALIRGSIIINVYIVYFFNKKILLLTTKLKKLTKVTKNQTILENIKQGSVRAISFYF